jgi:calcineurin-like phosphoesterase family protein
MSLVYTISDPHFGHENMAIRRGFKNAEEQDNLIIENWNKTVNKKDVILLLGDITMESSKFYHYLNKLNGLKRVVLGNHDMPQDVPKLLPYVHSVCGMYKREGCIFTHAPIHPDELRRFRKNVHGHCHEETVKITYTASDKVLQRIDDRYVNVCCEVVNYTPVLLSSLL